MTPLYFLLISTLILCLIFVITVFTLWFISWVTGKAFSYSMPFAPFGWTALSLVILTILTMGYGFYIGRWRLNVTNLDYINPDIPKAFNGYKIVHISDLHLSTFDDAHNQLEKIISKINEQKPDLICFTGDLVTIGSREATPYVDILKKLDAKDGVLSVMGNHDFLIYNRFESEAKRENEVDRLYHMEEDTIGWKMLRNESTVIRRGDDSITVIGVDNQCCSNQGFRTIAKGDLKAAMKGTSGFRILMSHDPSHWSGEILPDTDIPLTLSGHTHAAQIRLFGWTPAKLSFIETDGRYDKDGQTLYINIGLGCTAPIRIGANPEITVITLQSEK